MDIARPSNSSNFLTLHDTAQQLGVSVDVLLEWNERNILKPIITQTGQVGYTREQVTSFLAIRQISQIDQQKQIAASQEKQTTKDPLSAFWPVMFLTFVLIAAIIYTQYDKITKLFNTSTQHIAQVAMTSGYNVALSSPNQSVQFDQTDDHINDLADATGATNTIVRGLLEKKTETTQAGQSQQPVVQPLTEQPDAGIAAMMQGGAVANMASTNFFASKDCPSCQEGANSVFDANGNLKGSVSNAALLAAFDPTKASLDENSIQSPNLNILLTMLTIALFSFGMFFRKHHAYSLHHADHGIISSLPITADNPSQKILEVTQKTDGTVVVFIDGKEFKICKPELNSESDQFIGRLMELTKDDVKEIEYDITNDEKIKLYAPLSKIVTRLGFVGVKRDLFFPRTAKSSVLFRQYLTKEDILALHLPLETIANYL